LAGRGALARMAQHVSRPASGPSSSRASTISSAETGIEQAQLILGRDVGVMGALDVLEGALDRALAAHSP
jgi:hypothetical protein